MSDQKISCEGCCSKWVLVGVGNQIAARLVECPLCSDEIVLLREFLMKNMLEKI